MFCSAKNPAARRYVVRSLISAGLVIVFAVLAAVSFHLWHLHGPLAYVVAVLPALPILGALVATGIYLGEEKDEFQRNLLVQSLLGGIGGTLALTTIWGYLEDYAKTPRMDLISVYAWFWIFAGVSYAVVRRRYK
jgi:hypothetical protein